MKINPLFMKFKEILWCFTKCIQSHKMFSNWFWNDQDVPFEIEGVNIWFRLIKPICNLECKIFGHFFYYLWTSKIFCNYTPNTSKITKIIEIDFEINKICSFKMKKVIVGFRKIKPKWILELKLFDHLFLQNQIYIQYYINISIFSQKQT